MSRSNSVAFGAIRVVAIAGVALALSTPAWAQSGGGRPFGSVYSGLGYGAQWGYNWNGKDYDNPNVWPNMTGNGYPTFLRLAPVARAPYFTGQYHKPGDGYRYPLYYNPSTRGYVYYPVAR
jgi:hypothetical protein